MYNWKQYKLCELAEVQLSNVDKKTTTDEKTIRLCNYTDVYNNAFIDNEKSKNFMIATCNDNEFNKFLLKEGQVAITKDSETTDDIGVPTYIANDFQDVVLGYHLSLITPNRNKLDGKFLHYWLNTKQAKYYFTHNSGGSGQRCSLSLDAIKSTPIFIPAIETQKLIGNILFDLDSKIEINNRINAELEAMAKTIYDYWFVQFDFPDKNGKPYKSSGGIMVYNKELNREIPSGWEVDILAELIDGDKSGDWGKEKLSGNYTLKVNCIRGTDLNGLNGRESLDSPLRYILEKNKDKILKANDIIIEISGGSTNQSTGRMAFITVEALERFNNPIICSNFCKAISLKEEKHLFFFTLLWNEIYNNNILFNWEGKTSGIKNLLFDSFVEHYKTVIPPNELIEKFNSILQPFEKMKQKKLLENQQLTELRDWLLPMLMNGQVTVKDAEEIINKNTTTPKAAEPKAKYKAK